MAEQSKQYSVALNENMAVMSACLELGAAAIEQVIGGEEASNQLDGQPQNSRDIQELLASRVAKAFGV